MSARGVITCNYDGMAKHKTRIGKNVFIGSDSQLVAPLDIASDVLIGAGSTITKDCVQGDLALSRTEQRNIAKGFFRFFKRGSRGFLFLATHYFKKNLFRNSFLQGRQKPLKHNKPSFLFL